jgi:hypothetical protein
MSENRKPRVAVVDSGVELEAAGGVNLCGGADWRDNLGHGAIVAAAIVAQAPEVEIFAVKIFDHRLQAPAVRLCQALVWCAAHSIDFVNLSLGFPLESPLEFPAPLPPTCTIIAPAGCFSAAAPNRIAVRADIFHKGPPKQIGDALFRAAPWPPPLPGRPSARLVSGVSFAVANVTAYLAGQWRKRESAGPTLRTPWRLRQ